MSVQIETNEVTLKKLIYVQDILQKNLIKRTMEQEGIIVIEKSSNLTSVFGELGCGEDLYVSETDYEKALEVLQELEIQEVDFDELEKLAVSYEEENRESDNSLYEHKKMGIIKIIPICAIILVIGMIYKYSNPVIRWHDETLKWIVVQELNKNIEDDIRISDVSQIMELSLDGEEIKDLKDLKYFFNLKVLELRTPKVDNLNSIKNLVHLDKLVLCGLDIKTLDSLNKLHLSDLTLQDLPLLSIKPLGQMEKLQNLKLQGLPISSIQSLAGAKSIEKLNLENMDIDDLEVLKDLPNLSSISMKKVKTIRTISLNQFDRYKDVTLSGIDVQGRINSPYMDTLIMENIDLRGMKDWIHAYGLKHLTLNHCQLKDISILYNLTKLESLNMADNAIQSIEILKDFTGLRTLSLADNPIIDLSPICALKNIEILDLSGIDFQEQEDFISDMKLNELRLSNCNITEINFLDKQKELKWLDLSQNKIKDIEPLRVFRKELKHLDISENPVSNFAPLSEWFVSDSKSIEEGAELNISGISLGEKGKEHLKYLNLKRLYARSCGISDVEFIRCYKNLQYLDMSDNQIKYFESLLSLPYLSEVNAKGNLITEEFLLFGITTNWRREGAMRLTSGVYGCPVNWKNYYIGDEGYESPTWFRIIID